MTPNCFKCDSENVATSEDGWLCCLECGEEWEQTKSNTDPGFDGILGEGDRR